MLDKPETKVATAAAPVTEAFFERSCTFCMLLCVCTDFSFSLSQLLHFQWIASLHSGQYSKAINSFPHALHNILSFLYYSGIKDLLLAS